jgi:hypothetical protein
MLIDTAHFANNVFFHFQFVFDKIRHLDQLYFFYAFLDGKITLNVVIEK